MAKDEIKVLVVDDSALMRAMLFNILNAARDITVVGTANNGLQAVQKVQGLKPDVITMDLEMPECDGQHALERIMVERPTPVIMVSAYTRSGAHSTLKALNSGAFDFFHKGEGSVALEVRQRQHELIAKVKVAARVNVKTLLHVQTPSFRKPTPPSHKVERKGYPFEVVVIGASTGGPGAIELILSGLDADFPAGILIAQHMPQIFTDSFATRLDGLTPLKVKEAKKGDRIEPGVGLLCPGDRHMIVEGESELKSSLNGAKRDGCRPGIVSFIKAKDTGDNQPSVNLLMQSAADLYGSRSLGVLLTGMGEDGAAGLKAIKSAGGMTIAQDEPSSVVYGMPRAAVDIQAVSKVMPLMEIAGFLKYSKHLMNS